MLDVVFYYISTQKKGMNIHMERQIWNTLAFDNIGTHKMRFKNKLTLNEAIELGKRYCKNNNMTYVNTYEDYEIDEQEKDLRIKLNKED